jgi:hypothetical protein
MEQRYGCERGHGTNECRKTDKPKVVLIDDTAVDRKHSVTAINAAERAEKPIWDTN